MKKTLLKIIAAFVFVLTMMISLGTIKTYAASTYSISTYFTFSSDMDIDKGFELIKPYILYKNDNPCFEDYTFKVEDEDEGWYRYIGTYPDGTTFSIHSKIKIMNDASGTYVESMNAYATRQSIIVTHLKEGKTTSDCLSECWKNRFVNVTYPSYTIEKGSTPGSNIYNNLTSYTNGAGETKQLQYYAIYDEKSTPEQTTPDEVIDIGENTNPNQNEDIDIHSNDEPNHQEVVDEPTNNDSPTNTKPNNNQISQSNETNKINPLTITLICVGSIIGLILIYEIYKLIRLLIIWLKR